jgi:hypothetical protein
MPVAPDRCTDAQARAELRAALQRTPVCPYTGAALTTGTAVHVTIAGEGSSLMHHSVWDERGPALRREYGADIDVVDGRAL